MRYLPLVLAAGVALGACASEPVSRLGDVRDPFYRLSTVSAAAAEIPQPPRPGQAVGYRIEMQFRRMGDLGAVISAPALVVYPEQRANIVVANQVSYIETFTTELSGESYIADPVIGVAQDGLSVELVASAVAGNPREVALGYHVVVDDLKTPFPLRNLIVTGESHPVTIQLPRAEISEAIGARRIETGTTTLLAHIPDTESDEHVAVFVRVLPIALPNPPTDGEPKDFPLEPDAEGAVDLRSLAHAGGTQGSLVVDAVVLTESLPIGVPIDAAAANAIGGAQSELRSLGVVTVAAPGVRVAGLLQESYLADYDIEVGQSSLFFADPVIDVIVSGLTAEVNDEGRLRISWTTTPTWEQFTTDLGAFTDTVTIDIPDTKVHEVVVPLTHGRRLVPLARLAEGGTAAVWVSFTEQDPSRVVTGAPRGPRLSASHADATIIR